MRTLVYILLILITLSVVGCRSFDRLELPSSPDLDSDRDGVPEVFDRCPNTPPGRIVNQQGCDADKDNDGVLNSKDLCDNTPAGDVVQSDGCTRFEQKPNELRCIPDESGTSCIANLPFLEWPLPAPSVAKSFQKNEVSGLDMSTIGGISSDLEAILVSNGYERFSYYHVPLGVAMVTQLERIEIDGTPFPDPNRWKYGDLSLSQDDFSFSSFLKRLLGIDEGNYRVLVFVVSHESLNIKFPTSKASTQFVKTVAKEGALSLPNKIAAVSFDDDIRLSLMIYELKLKQTDKEAVFFKSGLQVREHLYNTGIIIGGDE
ncbi:MAG: hypothetical protein ACJA1Z_002850 [Patiriisocius sp.]|jgi:hypothetical protein